MKLKDSNGGEFEFYIQAINKTQAPLKKDGWNFNWKELMGNKKKLFFGLFALGELQGLVSLEIQMLGSPMMFMHQIEIAPHNIGGKGRFKSVAGALLAYSFIKVRYCSKPQIHIMDIWCLIQRRI